MEYRVTWEIDVDADTPEEAAREALQIMRDHPEDNMAQTFVVRPYELAKHTPGVEEDPGAVVVRKDVTQAVLADPESFIGKYLDFLYEDNEGGSGLVQFVRYVNMRKHQKRHVVMEVDDGYGFYLRPELVPVPEGMLPPKKLVRIEQHAGEEAMLAYLLESIAGWTTSRWDQHLRNEVGDEDADRLIQWLEEKGVKPYRGKEK